MALRISRHDLFAGGLFVALGAFFSIESLNYDLGTPFRMGPGFLPLVLGGVLAALGLAVIFKGVGKPAEEGLDPPSWRAIVLICGAVGFFAVAVRGLGFVPTVFISVLVTAFASRATTLLGAVAVAAGLTVLSTVIFVIGLRLQVPMLGPWLNFQG